MEHSTPPTPTLLACAQSIALVLAQRQSWNLSEQDAARLALSTLRPETDALSLTLADELARGLQVSADRNRRELHGLEVHPAPLAEKPALLCYTPNWEHRENGSVFSFEGDHVGAVEFCLDAWAWCPVDTDWMPLDKQGESFDPTFGRPAENLERRAQFERPEDAICFLAAIWNQRNPSQAVSLGKAA